MKTATETESRQIESIFLYNTVDRQEVEQVYQELRRRGLNPWMDVHDLRPGDSYQSEFAKAATLARSAVVFFGKLGVGTWESEELKAVVQKYKQTDQRMIPVLLPGGEQCPNELDAFFLRDRHRAQFEHGVGDPDVYDVLEFGITGKDPRKGRGLYQIQVTVPKAERTCFIAFPSNGSQDLYDTICRALARARIEVDPLSKPSSPRTPLQLSEAIRSSRLVVAACTPDRATNHLNSDAVFLLGYAAALGKPILLLSSDASMFASVLPPNVQTIDYKEHGNDSNWLQTQIAEKAQKIIDGLAHPYLIQPDRQDISIAYADLLRIPIAAWDKFDVILSFGLFMYRHFGESAKHLHKLNRDIQECHASATTIVGADNAFEWNWQIFERAYQDYTQCAVPRRADFLNENPIVLKAFEFLKNHTSGDSQKIVSDAKKYYDIAQRYITVFFKNLDRASELMEGANPREHLADLAMYVGELVNNTQVINSVTHGMMTGIFGFFGNRPATDNGEKS